MITPVQRDLYAVVGSPVSHSLSPIMMTAGFEALGHSAVYLAFEADSLEQDLDVLWRAGVRGLSVTLPHKEAVFRLALGRDDTAEAIGAVNTLKHEELGWHGRNTDWLGAVRALRRAAPLKDGRALVLGAGGVARAVVYGLKREGCRVVVANRDLLRGERLAEAFDCPFIPLDDLRRSPDSQAFDFLVQCTSVGLMGHPGLPLVPDVLFESCRIVMDTVYRPAMTGFLITARKAGCTLVKGSEMLLYQGVAQLEWWLGRSMPSEVVDSMRIALEGALLHG